MELKDYQKYRWFYTSSEKLVVGGKNADQNEDLIRKMKSLKEDKLIMHTQMPGSPFSFILAPISEIKKSDIKETAIFTASFSRAWREGKSNANIDIFNLSQLYKSTTMKQGTWGVKGKIKRMSAPISLVLAEQKKKLRAVPEQSVSKGKILIKIAPGKIDKRQMLSKLKSSLKKYSDEDIMSALPSGGVKII